MTHIQGLSFRNWEINDFEKENHNIFPYPKFVIIDHFYSIFLIILEHSQVYLYINMCYENESSNIYYKIINIHRCTYIFKNLYFFAQGVKNKHYFKILIYCLKLLINYY